MSSFSNSSTDGNVLTIKTVQISPFRTLMTALKDILLETNITFQPDGIRIINMDKSHTILVHLFLSAQNFEFYECKKEKIIIFCGKLNSAKGYDVFGKAIIKILNKYKTWSSVVAGNEKRETYNYKHEKLKIYDWISHEKILNLYNKINIYLYIIF
jgi:hypothetical protein